MTLLRVYIAVSRDGFIADAGDGVGWLDPYFSDELGFDEFRAGIGATVVGRRTFDRFGAGPGEDPVIVLTHRPLEGAPEHVQAFGGDVRDLAARLRVALEPTGKDVWLLGGGLAIRSFHEEGLVDRWELFRIPEELGEGVPLFPPGAPDLAGWRATPRRTYSNGIEEVWYERSDGPG